MRNFLILLIFNAILGVQTTENLQQEFINLRFGAFSHFGIRTFTEGKWGEAEQDTSKFNPIDTRYIKLEVLKANNDYAAATEIAIGRK